MLGLIGYGYVGKAVHELLTKKHEVVIKEIHDSYDEVNEKCNVVFVCVPTPMSAAGSVDLSIVIEAVSNLLCDLIIIKSTIPPGTTKELSEKYKKAIIFSPEYIGEGGYPVPFWDGWPHPTDMSQHEFTIFGGKREYTNCAIDIFKPCFGPNHKFIQTDSTTAEMTKYMENSWIASKITFCNEFFEIAKTFGVDYNELRELWLLDRRVSRSHTLVNEFNRGFDGKCIPKDVNGIAYAAKEHKYSAEYLYSILKNNERFRSIRACPKILQ